MAEAFAAGPLAREPWRTLRLLRAGVAYEQRRVSAFRLGFLVKEVLRGTAKPIAMGFVYVALFHGAGTDTVRGWTLPALVHYLVLSALLSKIGIDDRSLDVAEQVFDGYVTKYLVMPARYQALVASRWVHAVLLQLLIGTTAWTAGWLVLPDHWPTPRSAADVAMALALVIAGSYCYYLVFFIINALAFWLDVVWSLIVMFRFVASFASGLLIPLTLMPDALREALAWGFPAWTLSAPVEIFMGRQGAPEFLRGACVIACSAAALQLLAAFTWRRGLRRYGGAGM